MPYKWDGFRIVWFYHEDWLSMGLHGPKKHISKYGMAHTHLKCSQPSLMVCTQYADQHVIMLCERSSITQTKVFDP